MSDGLGGQGAAYAMEALIGRLLVLGTWLAMALVLAGVLLMLVSGLDPLAQGAIPPFRPERIIGDILALRPQGFLMAGLVLIVCLPVGRVLVGGVGFLASGDRRLAVISLLVLLVVVGSVVAAAGLGA
jgi:uncharacterized membrane protein